jgi:hypothetical protein
MITHHKMFETPPCIGAESPSSGFLGTETCDFETYLKFLILFCSFPDDGLTVRGWHEINNIKFITQV